MGIYSSWSLNHDYNLLQNVCENPMKTKKLNFIIYTCIFLTENAEKSYMRVYMLISVSSSKVKALKRYRNLSFFYRVSF